MSQPPAEEAELVVLVADDGTPIGTADKSVIHDGDTPLHLAFSCHVFRPDGRVLLTRRALGKRTFPGIWTNSFCGHPAPGEEIEDAVRRRAAHELGLEIASLDRVLPDFRYEAADASGIVENEICPVFRAVVDADPQPSSDEVAEWEWATPEHVRTAVEATPFAFSPWLVLQLAEWDEFGR
jgi:isopentenyl-diphosphate delta-isomerase